MMERLGWWKWMGSGLIVLFVCAVGVYGQSIEEVLKAEKKPKSVITEFEKPVSVIETEDEDGVLEVEPSIEIDLQTLLNSPVVSMQVAGDGVWEVRAQPGRVLLQIPLRIEAGDGVMNFGPGTLNVLKGRFLAWRLGEIPEQAPKGSKRSEVVADQLSEIPPTTVRRFSINEDGKVHWKLARVITGGVVVQSGRGYALRLDPEQLRKLHPGARPRMKRRSGESSAAYRHRSQSANVAYQAKAKRFKLLSKEIRALPKTFESQIPERIWAIIEVDPAHNVLGLTGPGELDWVIGLTNLQAIQDLVMAVDGGIGKTSGGGVGLTEVAHRAIEAMDGLGVNGGHTYSIRVAGYGVAMSNIVDRAEPGSQLFKLLNRLVLSEDAQTRRVVVKRLISTFPPTPGTRQLLAVASTEAIDAEVQLSRLSTLLTEGGDDPRYHRDLVVSANRMLKDKNGPSAKEVLGKLVEAAQGNKEAIATLEEGVRFAELDARRRVEAVSYVVGMAGSAELANRWLDRGLLGSVDTALVRLTLNTLDAAGREGTEYTEHIFDRGVSLLFGPGRAKAMPDVPRVKLNSSIPIVSADHGLIRVLEKQDEDLSALGWKVLRHFRLGNGTGQEDEATREGILAACDALVSVSMTRLPHEQAVVNFLSRQPEWTGSTDALMRLVLEGDSGVSLRSVRELKGSGRSLGASLQKLSPDGRHSFAARVYESDRGSVPLASGLVRASGRDGVVVDWFGKRVSSGQVPVRSEWARAFGGDERLLGTLVSNDDDLVAGAVGALVAMIGGQEADAIEMLEELVKMPEKTLVSLEAHWIHTKSEIFTTRIVESAGWYEMTLEVREVGGDSGFGERWDVDLGRVYVQTDGRSIRLGNRGVLLSIPSEQISIRVDNPEELKFVVNDQLERLPLDRIESHFDLYPQQDGAWVGEVQLVDGRSVELRLQPIGNDA